MQIHSDNWDISLLHRINIILVAWVPLSSWNRSINMYMCLCNCQTWWNFIISQWSHWWHGRCWAGRGCCWPLDTAVTAWSWALQLQPDVMSVNTHDDNVMMSPAKIPPPYWDQGPAAARLVITAPYSYTSFFRRSSSPEYVHQPPEIETPGWTEKLSGTST